MKLGLPFQDKFLADVKVTDSFKKAVNSYNFTRKKTQWGLT
jgi:hypothetical protein